MKRVQYSMTLIEAPRLILFCNIIQYKSDIYKIKEDTYFINQLCIVHELEKLITIKIEIFLPNICSEKCLSDQALS